MDKLKISANGPLNGKIIVSGVKNATPPLICAGLLTSDTLRLRNIPVLTDVKTTQKLLQGMGACTLTDNISELEINGGTVNNTCAPYEPAEAMRTPILVLGPTLIRFGEAQVNLPDGCAIGSCLVDRRLRGLETMGAEITIEHDYVKVKGRLKDMRVIMDVVTVDGTENLLTATTLAESTTTLENCAIEPKAVDLAECLVKMGAKTSGIGTATMTIEGVKELHGCEHSVVPDRIKVGTLLCAVVMTGGKVVLRNAAPKIMEVVLNRLTETDAITEAGDNWISVDMQQCPKAVDIHTVIHSDFPTDMQAQFMVINVTTEGSGRMMETIFESRLMYVPELNRIGADITTESSTAYIKGAGKPSGAVVMATGLCVFTSFVMAGLVAEGETIVERIHHLDRGYGYTEKKLGGVGAKIECVCG